MSCPVVFFYCFAFWVLGFIFALVLSFFGSVFYNIFLAARDTALGEIRCS